MADVVGNKISTRSLLQCGVIAGPLYVSVSLAQALTREGFDLSRHAWSLLANGRLGWIQIANFIISGLLVVAFAVGLGRALSAGRVATLASIMMAGYGVSLVVAGIFRADPALGFPVGTPAGMTPISSHGVVHFAAGGIGFTCLAVACFLVGGCYSSEGRRGWALYSRATGVIFLSSFAVVASGGGSATATLVFTAGVLWVWTWMTSVARERQRAASAGS